MYVNRLFYIFQYSDSEDGLNLMVTIPSLLRYSKVLIEPTASTISIGLSRVEQLLRCIVSLTGNRDGDKVKTKTDISQKAVTIV